MDCNLKVLFLLSCGIALLQAKSIQKRSSHFSCSFENDLCGMTQASNDQFDWTRQQGPTPSDPTGPSWAAVGNYYIYIECSNPRKFGDSAFIYLPVQNPGTYCLRFQAHMYGFHVNQLSVILNEPGKQLLPWSKTGDQKNRWIQAEVDIKLSPDSKVGFMASCGSAYTGDIALDDLELREGACGTVNTDISTTSTTKSTTTSTTTSTTSETSTQSSTATTATTTEASTVTTSSTIKPTTPTTTSTTASATTQKAQPTSTGISSTNVPSTTRQGTNAPNTTPSQGTNAPTTPRQNTNAPTTQRKSTNAPRTTPRQNTKAPTTPRQSTNAPTTQRQSTNAPRTTPRQNTNAPTTQRKSTNAPRTTPRQNTNAMTTRQNTNAPTTRQNTNAPTTRQNTNAPTTRKSTNAPSTTPKATSRPTSTLAPTTQSTSSKSTMPTGNGKVLFSCGFESAVERENLCGMTQATNDNFDWSIESGSTPSSYTGPTAAYEGFFYMFIEASSPRKKGDVARMLLPDLKVDAQVCVSFAYNMYGFHIGSLEVGKVTPRSAVNGVWKEKGQLGSRWHNAEVTVSLTQQQQLAFVATRGFGYMGDIAVDSIVVTEGSCSTSESTTVSVLTTTKRMTPSRAATTTKQPLTTTTTTTATTTTATTAPSTTTGQFTSKSSTVSSTSTTTMSTEASSTASTTIPDGPLNWQCDFEGHLCGMTQETSGGDVFDWTLTKHRTPSDYTGPMAAYSKEHFVFIEASQPRKLGDDAILRLPQFSRSGEHCVEFYYHMYGHHIGSLILGVYRFPEVNKSQTLWELSGQQENEWKVAKVNVDFSNPQDQLAFTAIRGSGYAGDIAVDKVTVREGMCSQ